ncbi:MAG: DUF3108 domain-containing protein [Bryobacterales bacterium]|nr:DUF3108 domain-containing protein [Bryobacterales bacterium]
MNLLSIFFLSLPLWSGVPTDGESLQYTINWPSGLSLGEGRIKASRSGANWSFELQFDAAIPGFAIADNFVSLADAGQCSLLFERDLQHGKRKSKEKITFDQAAGTAVRETQSGGGKTTLQTGSCAKDALAFLFHLRSELAKGRIPPPQNAYYGAPYNIRLQHKGSERIRLGDAMEDSDKIAATIKGPASTIDVELFIGKDANRTPLLVKIPLAMGQFSLELVR